MTTYERRMAIIEVLCERRFEKIGNLAYMFNVGKRTIEKDIVQLSFDYPLYTKTGKYGGVFVMEGFHLKRKYLSQKQATVLEGAIKKLSLEEQAVITSILKDFKKPSIK